MVTTLLVWLLIIFQSAVFGHATYSLVFSNRRSEATFSLVTPQKILTGFVILSGLVSSSSLFLPLNNIVIIGFIFSSVSLFIILKPKFSVFLKNKKLIGLLLLILVFSLETSTRRPLNPDTNIYHAQAIHWLESFQAIPGLGNLHGRLAFNSSWFIINAFYSFNWLFGQSLHIASGFFFFFFSAFALSLIDQPNDIELKRPFFALSLIFFAFQFLASDISSPGTDTPASLTTWLILLIAISDDGQISTKERSVLLVLLSIFAVTIKLSSVVLLLFPLGLFVKALYQKNFKIACVYIFLSGLLFAPYLLRNLIQSGYLLYPFPNIDLFNFEWKVPLSRVVEERDAILVWGRLSGQPIRDVLEMPIWVWLPLWFKDLTLARKLMVILALSSSFFFLLNVFLQKLINKNQFIQFVFIIGTYFWLLTTPDFRFGYSYLIPSILLIALPFIEAFEKYLPNQILKLQNLGILFLATFVLFATASSLETNSFLSRGFLPKDYDKVKTTVCEIDGTPIFCSVEFNDCSYHDFPCVPQYKGWVHMFGSTFQDGFYGNK